MTPLDQIILFFIVFLQQINWLVKDGILQITNFCFAVSCGSSLDHFIRSGMLSDSQNKLS